jgi:hypothetical protein
MTCTCASPHRLAMKLSRPPVRTLRRERSQPARHGTDGSGRPCGKQTEARRGEHVTEPDGPAADTPVPAEQAADLAIVAGQLGRTPRGVMAIAHRCPCGLPDVVQTAPRLDDGTPFPTLFYLTCPRACSAMSTLEAAGVMREMTARLQSDKELRGRYLAAHEDYLARRDEAAATAGLAPLPPGTQSAGGMPDRVKCLHALAAHALAVPGGNPLGAEALHLAGQWWHAGPCVSTAPQAADAGRKAD